VCLVVAAMGVATSPAVQPGPGLAAGRWPLAAAAGLSWLPCPPPLWPLLAPAG
jgi:hypothetical protein